MPRFMPRPDRTMENNNNHNQHNGGGNGFLLGVIVGVLITLLFSTKRGRAILKEAMEKGFEKFANLEQLMRETEEEFEDEDAEGDDYVQSVPVEVAEPQKIKKEPVKKSVEENPQPQVKKEEVTTTKPVKVEPPSEQIETVHEENNAAVEEEPAEENPEEEKPKAA